MDTVNRKESAKRSLAPDVQEAFWRLHERRRALLYTLKEINKRYEDASKYQQKWLHASRNAAKYGYVDLGRQKKIIPYAVAITLSLLQIILFL